MNVFILNDYATVRGGADEVAISEAAGLAAAGHRVEFVAGDGETPDSRLGHPGITLHCLNLGTIAGSQRSASTFLRGLWDSRSESAIRELLRCPTESLVHVHGWTKALTAGALRAVVQSGRPATITLHDYFSVCPNGTFYHFPKGRPCGLAPMSLSCVTTGCDRRSQAHKVWRVARQALTAARVPWPGAMRHAIAVSAFSAEHLRPWLPADCVLDVLSNPIDVPREPRVEAEVNRPFIFVGRITADKGVLDFAAAARAAGVPAVFVGTGDMEGQVRAVLPEATLTGWLDRAGVAQQFRAARALVFPSRWWETQGMVCLEALARGVPVIAARTTGAADRIVDGRNGLLVPPGDVAALTDALGLLRDDNRVGAMSEAAYGDYWAAPSTPEWHVAELIKLYTRLEQVWRPKIANA